MRNENSDREVDNDAASVAAPSEAESRRGSRKAGRRNLQDILTESLSKQADVRGTKRDGDGEPISDAVSVHSADTESIPGLVNIRHSKQLPDDVLKVLQCLDSKLAKKSERLIRLKFAGEGLRQRDCVLCGAGSNGNCTILGDIAYLMWSHLEPDGI